MTMNAPLMRASLARITHTGTRVNVNAALLKLYQFARTICCPAGQMILCFSHH